MRVPPRSNLFRWISLILISSALLLILLTYPIATNYTPQTLDQVSYTKFQKDLKGNRIESLTYERPSQGSQENELVLYVKTKDGKSYQTQYPNLPDPLSEALTQRDVAVTPLSVGWPTNAAQTTWLICIFFLKTLLTFLLFLLLFMLFARIGLMWSGQLGNNRWIVSNKPKKQKGENAPPDVTFASMAGSEEAKEETQELIRYLRDPTPFQAIGAKLPKGVLLSGPPGTGKTLMAKAIAGEASVPFLACSGSEFEEKYVGVGASRIRKLFQTAKQLAPCLIFVDEIDSVGRRRRSLEGNVESQTLNQLLIEMDGFDGRDHVVVFAATNRPEDLDPALVRPGRFDRQIVLHAPSLSEREAILKVHAQNVQIDENVDFQTIARMTVGFVGADLANLINESALCAVRSKHSQVTREDFEQAFDRISMGLKRSSIKPSIDEQARTAYHEAGHAIVSLCLPHGDPVHKVTILPRGSALGLTHYLPDQERLHLDKAYFYHKLSVCCGGRAAEEFIYGKEHISIGSSSGSGSDFDVATHLARAMVTQYGFSEDFGLLYHPPSKAPVSSAQLSPDSLQRIENAVRSLLEAAYAKAFSILKKNRALLHKMKEELLAKETLDTEAIAALLLIHPLQL